LAELGAAPVPSDISDEDSNEPLHVAGGSSAKFATSSVSEADLQSLSDALSGASPDTNVSLHAASVRRRLEVALSPVVRFNGATAAVSSIRGPRGELQHRRVTRAEMFASPAGLMSAIPNLPSVDEIDEHAQRIGRKLTLVSSEEDSD